MSIGKNISTRKMKMFYWTLVFIGVTMVYSLIEHIKFTGEEIGNMVMWFLFWVALMAGANVGEYFGKAFMERAKNGKRNNSET